MNPLVNKNSKEFKNIKKYLLSENEVNKIRKRLSSAYKKSYKKIAINFFHYNKYLESPKKERFFVGLEGQMNKTEILHEISKTKYMSIVDIFEQKNNCCTREILKYFKNVIFDNYIEEREEIDIVIDTFEFETFYRKSFYKGKQDDIVYLTKFWDGTYYLSYRKVGIDVDITNNILGVAIEYCNIKKLAENFSKEDIEFPTVTVKESEEYLNKWDALELEKTLTFVSGEARLFETVYSAIYKNEKDEYFSLNKVKINDLSQVSLYKFVSDYSSFKHIKNEMK